MKVKQHVTLLRLIEHRAKILCWIGSTVLVDNQLDAQFILLYVYLNPLHVSSNYILILRRTIVLTLRLLISYIYIYIYIYIWSTYS